MAKTSTSFKVCYIDGNGEKQIKNINDLTFEERGSIEKMAILSTSKTSTIGNFTSALSAKKNDKGEIVRIGFPNLKVLYGPAGVASISVEALRKATACPSLQNYVGLARSSENIAPKFVESSGVAINSEETPTRAGAFAIVSTEKDDVSGFVSEDDFYNGVVVDNGKVASSVVTIKVNPSKADLMQGPKTPGILRQKADEIRATQEVKANTASILSVVSALNENGVSLSDEQKSGLLSSFEAFVIANKGLSKEEAEAMKVSLQEDIHNVGVKLADGLDSNTEKVMDNVTSGKNEILDRLQTASKKAEQVSANDRAVNFAEHSKTRTVVANEGKRTTQETVEALKEYLSSEDFAKFVAESTPVDKVLGGIEKITSTQNDDIAYLLQEVGVNLSAPQVQRLTEAFKDGLEDSATSTAKTIQDMITFATEAVKSQMTVEGVKLSAEQEKAFTDGLSKRFLEERILNEKTISDVVGKATSATIASMENIYARLDDELVAGFAMTSEDIKNTNDNVNRVRGELRDGYENLVAQGEQTQSTVVELRTENHALRKELARQNAENKKILTSMQDSLYQLTKDNKLLKELLTELLTKGVGANPINIYNGVTNMEKTDTSKDKNATVTAQVGTDTQAGNQTGSDAGKQVSTGDATGNQTGTGNSTGTQTDTQGGKTSNGEKTNTESKNEKTNTEPKNEKTNTESKNEKTNTKPKKVKVLKENVETMGMLKEPKLPWYKRLGKFIMRHPFRSMLIGLGAGALIATGVGAVALGGLAPALATANAFAPTIAIGAAGGAGLGLIGSVASRISRKGRRERAYTKFMKKYNKALKRLEKVKEKDAQIATLDAEIKGLREKHRSGTLLSKVGVYKACRGVKNRVLKSKKRKLDKDIQKYSKSVDKADKAKARLNKLEDKGHTTNAVGGYLAKRAKLEARYAGDKITEEEREEDLEDLDYDLTRLYGGKKKASIAEVADTYKTGDAEMANLIDHFTNEKTINNRVIPSSKANATMDAIKKRNTKVVEIEGVEDVIPPVTEEEFSKVKGNTAKRELLLKREEEAKSQAEAVKRYMDKHPEEQTDDKEM